MNTRKKRFYIVLAKISILTLTLISGCTETKPAASPGEVVPTRGAASPGASPSSPTEALPTASETLPPTSTPTPEPSPTRPAVEVIKNIEYGSLGEKQTLDIYLSTEMEGFRPVILMLHEGGGNKTQFASWGRSFAKEGYAVVASNYRGWPDNAYPEDVSDAFCALAWIHAHAAEYNFDANNVFVLGHSAGGTLAAMLGVVNVPDQYLSDCAYEMPESNWVQGVITFTGIFDYASIAQASSGLKSYAEALFGGSQEEKTEIWAEASAITQIDGSEPPFLLLHGGSDNNIPPSQSMGFAQALEDAGVPVELMIVQGASHYEITKSAASVESVLLFLSDIVQSK